ncbi:MAG: hypothetical protein KDA63_18760 [Planctomycetales bacterium]|nr:hypothetical protein [Planctomycetales bacterium]
MSERIDQTVVTEQRGRSGGWPTLAVVLLAVAVIWGVVLPRLGEQPAVRARIERFERQGIEPAALFYSDLPAMSHWEAEVARARAECSEKLGESGAGR